MTWKFFPVSVLLCVAPLAMADMAGQPHKRFAWLANDPNNTYDNATLAGIKDVTGNVGHTVDPFYAGFDPSTQLQQCMDALHSRKYDGLFVESADAVAIEPCVAEARQKGVPVVATDLPIGPDLTTVQPQVPGEVGASFIPATSWAVAMRSVLPQVCQGLNPCNVFYLAGDEALAIDILGIQAVLTTIAANPSMVFIGEDQAFYDTPTSLAVMTAALTAHPEINVVLAAGDQMALGAEQAAAALGLHLRIVGGGAGASAIDAVKQGRWFGSFNALPRTEGQLGATLMENYLANPNTPPVGIDPVVFTGLPAMWTQATLAQYPNFVPQWPGPQ